MSNRSGLRLNCSIAAALLAVPAMLGAQPPTLGGQFQVNTFTTDHQYAPSVDFAADGRFVVAWASNQSAGTDTDGKSIQAQRFAADGMLLGGQFQVNSSTPFEQHDPSVGVAADTGNFVVVWESFSSTGTDTDLKSIQGQRYAVDGTPLGAEFQVNTYTTSAQQEPAIAVAASGDFVVVWQSAGGGTDTDNSIQAQRFAADASLVGAQFQVNSYTTGNQLLPAIGMDASGSFAVVWQSTGSTGTDSNGTSIQGQRFSAAGAALNGEFQVNSYTTLNQDWAAVAVEADGDFVVAWASVGSTGGDTDNRSIQAQRYDATGAPVAGEFQVNSYTTSAQNVPMVDIDADGNFAVVWTSNGSALGDTSSAGILGQRYDSSGAAVGGEFQANSYTTDYQGNPTISVAANGNFIVSWLSVGSPGDDAATASIQAQRYGELSPCAGLPSIFADDFDAGAEDPAWSVVKDPLNHLTGAGGGLAGTAASIEVLVDHDPPGSPDKQHFVLDQTPDGISSYCVEWIFVPNTVDIFGKIKIYAARGDDGFRLLRLMLRENPGGSPPYQLRFSARNDSDKWVNLDWVGLDDVETVIALGWKQGSGVADGEFRIFLDGILADERLDFNNDDRSLGAQAIGNLGLFNAGTLGTPSWDEFASFGD